MDKRYTADELNTMASEDLYRIILKQQEQLSHMADNYEKLLEQLRIATQTRFGRRTEKLDAIDGQLSLFDEAEAFSDPTPKSPQWKKSSRLTGAGSRKANVRKT